jgi:RHS repeat-associated protein
VLKDHLGSTAAFVNSSGSAQVNESFRAFGVERSPTDWASNTSSADTATIAGISRRGFTFESTLTNPGTFTGMMVHLNGRVLDGFIGRMLSPDPYIPDPGNTQDFNRYAYARNNPLTLADPSGFDQCITVSVPGDIFVDEMLNEVFVGPGYSQQICLPDFPAPVPGAPGGGATPPGGGGHTFVPHPGHRPDRPPAPIGNPPPQQGNSIKDFLCKEPAENNLKDAADTAGNVGSVADVSKPAVEAGALAAGLSKNLNNPQATRFLGNIGADVLEKAGHVGSVVARGAIAYDLINLDFQSALYDYADYVVYSKLAKIGAGGAIETGGESVALATAAVVLYAGQGGSRGIVQSALCE